MRKFNLPRVKPANLLFFILPALVIVAVCRRRRRRCRLWHDYYFDCTLSWMYAFGKHVHIRIYKCS